VVGVKWLRLRSSSILLWSGNDDSQ